VLKAMIKPRMWEQGSHEIMIKIKNIYTKRLMKYETIGDTFSKPISIVSK
jgi:hypothetical protein